MCPLFRGLTLRSYRKDEPLSSDTFWGKPFSHPIDEVGISNLEVTFGNGRVVDRFSLDSQEEANEIEVVFCGKSPLSKYNMTMISTLSNCTCKGRKFTDQANYFSLEIPKGAIPVGERLTIDVGVALLIPFQFLECLRPVSAVFWVCIRDNVNYRFSKPVTVTIPHFLNFEKDRDVQCMGVTFIKAHHNTNVGGVSKFWQTDGKVVFRPLNKFGFLQTTHFCSLCIACKDKPEVLTKTNFSIISVIPARTVADGTKQYAFFFITFSSIKTCLKKVDELLADTIFETYRKEQLNLSL